MVIAMINDDHDYVMIIRMMIMFMTMITTQPPSLLCVVFVFLMFSLLIKGTLLNMLKWDLFTQVVHKSIRLCIYTKDIELNWIELNGIEMNWLELDWIE